MTRGGVRLGEMRTLPGAAVDFDALVPGRRLLLERRTAAGTRYQVGRIERGYRRASGEGRVVWRAGGRRRGVADERYFRGEGAVLRLFAMPGEEEGTC